PLNQIALLFLDEGRTSEALPLAEMAAQLSPSKAAYAAYSDTVAEILLRRGQPHDYNLAQHWAANAVNLDRKNALFVHTLALCFKALGDNTRAFDNMKQAAALDSDYEKELESLSAQK